MLCVSTICACLCFCLWLFVVFEVMNVHLCVFALGEILDEIDDFACVNGRSPLTRCQV